MDPQLESEPEAWTLALALTLVGQEWIRVRVRKKEGLRKELGLGLGRKKGYEKN